MLKTNIKGIRVFREETTEALRKSRFEIGAEEVQYVEEYVGDILPIDELGPITTLRLHNGEVICVIEDFDSLTEKVNKAKAVIRTSPLQ